MLAVTSTELVWGLGSCLVASLFLPTCGQIRALLCGHLMPSLPLHRYTFRHSRR